MSVTKSITFTSPSLRLGGSLGSLSQQSEPITLDVTFTATNAMPYDEGQYTVFYDVTCDNMAIKGTYLATVIASDISEAIQVGDKQIEETTF